MTKHTVLLLLSLLVALVLPVHLMHLDKDSDNDNCNLRTAIVEEQLKKFANTNLHSGSSHESGNNCISPQVMREIMREVLEEQNLETKLEKLITEKLEKLEEVQEMKSNELKQQMMMNISGQIEKLGQSQIQNNSRIDEKDTKNSTLGKLAQIEETTTQVQEITKNTKGLTGCQKLLQRGDVKKTNMISADGKHFYVNTTRATWNKAHEWCMERGMQLATLKTLRQVRAVTKELYNNVEFYWLNYWVYASDIGRTPHGQFQWADGTPVDTHSWYSGQPDDAEKGRETCVYLSTADAKLRDLKCSSAHTSHIICEFPAALSSCFS